VKFALYQSEHDGCFPYTRYMAWDERLMHDWEERSYLWPWPYMMEVYGGPDSQKIMLCPMAAKPLPTNPQYGYLHGGGTLTPWVIKVPSSFHGTARECGLYYGGRVLYIGSYGVNGRLGSGRAGKVKPAALPTLFDCRLGWCHFEDASFDTPPPHEEWEQPGGPGGTGEFQYFRASFTAINRHQGGINMLFLDGAVRKVGLKELWTLKWHEDFDTAGPWTKAGGARPGNWPEWMRNFKDY
jgi:prepilin-type processing-associated H-X9-DG protein